MGKALWILVVAAAFQLATAGEFMRLMPSLIHRFPRSAPSNPLKRNMSYDEMVSLFVADTSYLIRREDDHSDDYYDSHSEDDDGSETRTMVAYGDGESSEESDVASRSWGGAAKFVLKKIGKLGLSLLKRGMKFLKSTFFKFGGKRLLKRAKKYLKEELFTLTPLDCEGTKCKTCAVLALPFKLKEFEACGIIGFERKDDMTNFTAEINIFEYELAKVVVEAGNISNCIGFPETFPDSSLAALIGQVCFQGFEFKIDTDKTGKFCLAVVFKRWGTGYRFCVERKEEKKKDGEGGGKKKPGKNGGGGGDGEESDNKKNNPKLSAKQKSTSNKHMKWKFTLKAISAGEQDNQIVTDTPLFKGEAKKRQEDSIALLQSIGE